jgi:hypothetical protein
MSQAKASSARGQSVDFDLALIDPAAAFGSPEDVVGDSRLTARNKIEILCRWAYDSAELSVAEEEGMGGGESVDLNEVLRALDRISPEPRAPDRVNPDDGKSSAPNKHAGFCAVHACRAS